MRSKNTNKLRHFSSLLNEHWKRKQRLKIAREKDKKQKKKMRIRRSMIITMKRRKAREKKKTNKNKRRKKDQEEEEDGKKVENSELESEIEVELERTFKLEDKKVSINMIDLFRAGEKGGEEEEVDEESDVLVSVQDKFCSRSQVCRQQQLRRIRREREPLSQPLERLRRRRCFDMKATTTTVSLLLCLTLMMMTKSTINNNKPLVLRANCQQSLLLQTDPRPTIYSGQVSFGLLLSAHSSLGSELSTSASYQVNSVLQAAAQQADGDEHENHSEAAAAATTTTTTTISANNNNQTTTTTTTTTNTNTRPRTTTPLPAPSSGLMEKQRPAAAATSNTSDWRAVELLMSEPGETLMTSSSERKTRRNRQIFEHTHRTSNHRRHQQQKGDKSSSSASQQQEQALAAAAAAAASVCSQTNPNALYAGMGAIWASHQANLVGDSQLAIGTYVYDSCNDLDVGQRQSVRIVSNLNAFQQTTCESPRGAPISLTIAHGDNQLRAIQLLTSFKVPVITTREYFDLEDYTQLSREQRRYLFSTAPSSRHLAVGALRFAKRIVNRAKSSPKLPNRHYANSPKNGLIVISRNLPARFIAYLIEIIPAHANYEMLQSSQPIDQIKSVEALESILIKGGAGSSSSSVSSSESRVSSQLIEFPAAVAPSIGVSGGETHKTTTTATRREKRNSQDSDSSDGSGSGDSEDETSDGNDSEGKMLSPTIIMFITPSEAIDLVTRLRNDLAEVSRYYSLIVSTREDISPALKTIFHRGGSRLCSGKAFYTISPKPDDISEFSRYFRDTVQMEGETSDHPLICEFAKFQSDTRAQADLDEISTEPVIKAVWAAASAFKLVYNRECAALAHHHHGASGSSTRGGGGSSLSPGGGQMTSNVYRAGGSGQLPDSEPSGEGVNSGRVMASGRRQSESGSSSSSAAAAAAANKQQAHSECMVRMNKNMAQLVRMALRRVDNPINSTGLQSLDGFRIKFDDQNELQTNKFSIKYINKECEITEIGAYSGLKDSALKIEEDALMKSVELALPEAWPARVIPPPTPAPPPPRASSSKVAASGPGSPITSSTGPSSKSESSPSSGLSGGEGGVANPKESSSGNEGGGADLGSSGELAENPAASNQRGRRKSSSSSLSSDGDEPSPSSSLTSGGDGGDGSDSSSDGSDYLSTPTSGGKKRRTSKRSRISEAASNERMSRRRLSADSQLIAASSARPKKSQQQNGGGGASNRSRKKKKETPEPAAPVTALSGGRNTMPGLTDTEPASGSGESVAEDGASSAATKLYVDENGAEISSTTTATSSGGNNDQPPPMRKVKPYPLGVFGTTLKDWLPQGGATSGGSSSQLSSSTSSNADAASSSSLAPGSGSWLSTKESIIQPTRVPALVGSVRDHDDNDLRSRATTQAPVYSTLPESGGNADLDLPPSTSRSTHSSTPSPVTTTTTTSTSITASSAGQPHTRVAKSAVDQSAAKNNNKTTTGKGHLETAESTDYVTSPSISKKIFERSQFGQETPPSMLRNSLINYETAMVMNNLSSLSGSGRNNLNELSADSHSNRVNYFKDHLSLSPVPLTSSSSGHRQTEPPHSSSADSQSQREGRSTLRSQLRWIYSSWFGLVILGANICGALMTLYVLTFLLMKNCDGSLDRENQGMRSMHLLAIIVVFFGSTLFIVYPTPGLCLLRTSWHNFALVMLFGSLLLHTMQTRSLTSLGLGGRPNRLNQFLTLVFMVGVQVAFELQRWKYESANYANFVNQYFGSNGAETNQKILLLSSAIGSQFNPLNAFNDQVTPVSIQVSEQYQSLLHDYCTQKADDFLSSQLYLCALVCLLVIFSCTIRKNKQSTSSTRRITSGAGGGGMMKLTNNHSSGSSSSTSSSSSSSSITSGKLVAHQHEANLLSSTNQLLTANPASSFHKSHVPFGGTHMDLSSVAAAAATSMSTAAGSGLDPGNMFTVTLLSAPIYSISLVLHLYAHNSANRDLISSVTMILIAFVALLGIFLPILLQMHRFNGLLREPLPGSLTRAVLSAQSRSTTAARLQHQQQHNNSLLQATTTTTHSPGGRSSSSAFALFPEFAPTGLRRPSSASGDSASYAGGGGGAGAMMIPNSTSANSRCRPFAETKESRRKMGAALANLAAMSNGSGGANSVLEFHEDSTQHQQQQQQFSVMMENGLSCSGSMSQINECSLPDCQSVAAMSKQQAAAPKSTHSSSKQQSHHQHHQCSGEEALAGHCFSTLTHGGGNGATTSRRKQQLQKEKRLIVLDVDPCCPKHGINAQRPHLASQLSSNNRTGARSSSHHQK